ncbi:hypothetical protein K435DRAFT_967301 [Dendrothele bispora CBS 962.96]|uniref:NYN domain-containing protein n=1 Tax=Dendrothele bispora (strain CBS 962.96) TaxID=1314807 RepID=A0A4S8LVH4_DENBC|nr:hypothetical protein K435DRAFT_967301 [Dendrothele bispora CBS 962.96]
MLRSNSDTTTTSTYSPVPTSPFSSNISVRSEPTSDETPDLGAFTTILRAWSHLQPAPRVVNSSLANAQPDFPSSSSSHTFSSLPSATRSRNLDRNPVLESDSDVREDRSTVWAHRRIASYLNYAETNTDTETDRDRPVSVFSSVTAAEVEDEVQNEHEDAHSLVVPIQDIDELDSSYDNEIYDDDDDNDRRDEVDAVDESDSVPPSHHDQELHFDLEEEDEEADGHTPLNSVLFGNLGADQGEQPSLGYLEQALKFIAAERERFTAQRETGPTASLTAGIEPRKRRRRKRTKTSRAHSTTRTTKTGSTITTALSNVPGQDGDPEDPDADADADADESSSSFDQNYSTSYSTSNYSSGLAAAASSMFKSMPGTPGASRRTRGRDHRQRQQQQLPSNPSQLATSPGKRRVRRSRSTPQLRIALRDDEDEDDGDIDEVTTSPRVAQLRALGRKLETLFPEDVDYLKKIRYTILAGNGNGGYSEMGNAGYGLLLSHPQGGKSGAGPSTAVVGSSGEGGVLGAGPGGIFGGFIDTRGPRPLSPTDRPIIKKREKSRTRKKVEDERLIHVFVDHSNILIGLINYLKRYPQKHPQYRHLIDTTVNENSPRTNPSTYPKPPKHLSHSALTLILERGRPVTRRVLVTSSPLYQPMESAAMLGFDVKVFARVPDYGDGMDREKDREKERELTDKLGSIGNGARNENGNGKKKGHKKSVSSGSFSGLVREGSGTSGSGSGSANDVSPKKTRRRAASFNNNPNSSSNASHNMTNGGPTRRKSHKRQTSGSNSTESEQGVSSAGIEGFPHAFAKSLARAAALASSAPTSNSASPHVAAGSGGVSSTATDPAASLTITQAPTPQRIRYREQGVDELLQLKLHQVLAALDGPPPPGSTIVLVTGDGNAGQFNEDGFLGGVRTALKKGWKVELYAWEGGLSRAWNREFGEGSELGSGFRIIGLEQFGTELVEIYY